MTRGEWFEFETLNGVFIDGGNLSLKVFFTLERDMKVFEDVGEEV